MTAAFARWRGRAFASLRQPTYRRFFITLFIAMTGFWLRLTAVGWYVYALTSSTEALGGVIAAALFPFVLFAPLGGAIADRIDQRRLISLLMLGIVLTNLALAAVIFAGIATFTHVLVYSFVAGCFRAMEHPARSSLVVRLVGREHLHNAIGLNAACFHFTATTGPLLAGLIYHYLGPGGCFVGVAIGAIPMAIILPGLDVRERAVPERESFAKQISAGFAYVATHAATRALVLTAAASIVLLWSFRTVMPAISRDTLGLGDVGHGAIMSVMGLGSFIGALWVAGGGTRRLDGARGLLPLLLMAAAGATVLGFAANVVVAGVGLIVAGFFQIAFMASANTQVQLMVPDALRARVMGVWALNFGLCFPLGGLWMGFVAGMRDTQFAILLSVAMAVLLVLLLQLQFRRRRRRSAVAVADEPGQLDQPLG